MKCGRIGLNIDFFSIHFWTTKELRKLSYSINNLHFSIVSFYTLNIIFKNIKQLRKVSHTLNNLHF